MLNKDFFDAGFPALSGKTGKFEKIHHSNRQLPPHVLQGLENSGVSYAISPAPYLEIRALLESDFPKDAIALNRLTYRAYLLFGDVQKTKRFALASYRKHTKENTLAALLDAINMPMPHLWAHISFRAWGDAFAEHGLNAINRLFSEASPIMPPHRNAVGAISLKRTEFNLIAAPFRALGERERFENFLDLSVQFKKTANEFRRALAYFISDKTLPAPPSGLKLPDLVIDGAAFGIPGATFKKIERSDPRYLYIGDFTHCCERITDQERSLEKTVVTTYKTGQNDYFIVEQGRDILAHSWAWRGSQGEMVFDGFESDEKKFTKENLAKLLDAAVKEIKQTEHADLYVEGICVGVCAKHLTIPKSLIKKSEPASKVMPSHVKGVGMGQSDIHVLKSRSDPTFV